MPDKTINQPDTSTLFALLDSKGKCKSTKFTKDMIIAQASVGDKILSYRLTKVESIGLAEEEAPKAGE